jgi:hypothetical protein
VRVVALVAILFALQVPALPLVAKYLYPTSHLLAAAAPIVNVAVAVAIIRSPLVRKRWVWPAILIVATLAVAFVYPIAEAHRPGSDSDDCVVLVTDNFLHGMYPYVTHTSYLGQACHDGPGEILLYAPLVRTNLYQLGDPLALALAVLMLASVSGIEAANILAILIFSTIATWQHLVTGTDYLTVGAVILIALIGLWENERARWWATLLGIGASSRVIFLFVIPVVGLLMWWRDRRRAVLATGIALLVGGVPTLALYLWSPANFSPGSVFQTGLVMIASPRDRAFGALVGVAAGILTLRWSRTQSLAAWCGIVGLVMIAPMAVASIGQLHNEMHWQLSKWAGGFMMFGVPTVCAWAALKIAPAGAGVSGREPGAIEETAPSGQERRTS